MALSVHLYPYTTHIAHYTLTRTPLACHPYIYPYTITIPITPLPVCPSSNTLALTCVTFRLYPHSCTLTQTGYTHARIPLPCPHKYA